MHKCFKCGTEFDGKFCPTCGLKWEEEKVCPECGANLPGEARFCNQCGYSFAGKAANVLKPQSDMPQKLFSALRLVPFAALALFSVLLFAFFAAPVAEMVMGEGFPNVSLGNVYSMQSGILSELPELNGSLTSLIVFAVIAFLYACAFGAVRFVRGYEFKKIKIAKFEISLASLLDYVSFIFYLIIFIIGVTVMGMISSADGGMGILISGACPIILMVFSIVFALLAVGSLVARLLLAKKFPELSREEKMREERYIEAEKARKEQYYATHTAPVRPIMTVQTKKEYNRSAVIYRHDKRRYDKAKEGSTPAAVIWLELHKAAVLSVAAILLVAIILISVLVPIFTNKFRVSAVEKINLGDNREKVIEILGEPNENLYNDTCWRYYSDKYTSIQEKIAKNIEKQEQAIEKGDEKMLLRLADEELTLEEQLTTVKYDFIEIEFTIKNANELSVSSVFFEKNRCDSNVDNKKEVKNVNLSTDTVGYYVDYTAEVREKFIDFEDSEFNYSAYYTDGSFYRTYLTSLSVKINGTNAITEWSDKIAAYTFKCKAIKIGSVNADGVWQSDYRELKTISLPENVTSIGERAFSGCTNLINISIPDSVTSIGEYVFKDCTAEIEWEGNSSITEIGKHAFSGYKGSNIIIPNSVDYIGEEAFKDCKAEIKWGGNSSITEIGKRAFCGYKGTSVTIPDSVTSIGGSAFEGCTNLESITVWDDNAAYASQDGILYNKNKTELIRVPQTKTSITIGSGVNSIGAGAFEDCTSLESITVSDDNAAYASQDGILYNKNKTELIRVPQTKTSITIGSGVTSIGSQAFRGCTSLESVYITDIAAWCNIDFGSYAANPLYYAHNLYLNNQLVTELTAEMLQGVNTIKDYAFYKCTSLTSVTIPDSVTSIAYCAFSGCTAEIKWGDNPSIKEIGQSAFSGFKGARITIPNSITSIGAGAFKDCTNLESVFITDIVAWCNIDFDSIYTNPLYYAHNLYLNNQLVTELTAEMLQGVNTIKDYAFNSCTSLKSITIPNSVISIGSYAFSDCKSLTSINIPNSVKSIGYRAFSGCTSLTSVKFENPNGWYCTEGPLETSGTNIPSEDLQYPATAAIYLKSTYSVYYLKRKTT